MTVNLNRNRQELLAAYADVRDDRCSTNWMLASYEPKSSALALTDKGDGGLAELGQLFDSCEIQYGLIRMTVPGSSVSKLILIHWQGESVPFQLLSHCGNHVREVERFFSGVHMTHCARNEDDVSPDAVSKALLTITSNLGFVKSSSDFVKPSAVSSVYQPVKPATEVASLAERQRFWAQAEKDDQERRNAEKCRRDQSAASIENEKQCLQERISRECVERIGQIKMMDDKPKLNGCPSADNSTEKAVNNVYCPSTAATDNNLNNNNKYGGEKPDFEMTFDSNKGDIPKEDGLCAVALWDYEASDDTEISFLPGDKICQIEKVDPGWWFGVAPDNSEGLFPSNYVKLLTE